MRKASEIEKIAEFLATGFRLFVATGFQYDPIADSDVVRRSAPRRQASARLLGAMRADRHAAPRGRAGGKQAGASGEPIVGIGADFNDKGAVVAQRHDLSRRFEFGGRQAAARVAEIGRAGRLVETALLLIELVGQRAQFGGESVFGSAHLADRIDRHQQPMADIRPIDEPGFDRRAVVKPGCEIVFVQAVGDKGAVDLAAAGGKAKRGFAACRVEPGSRRVNDAADDEIAIMIGETGHDAIAADQAPTLAKAGRLRVQTGAEFGRQCAHETPQSVISTMGMAGISPASKAARSTSR